MVILLKRRSGCDGDVEGYRFWWMTKALSPLCATWELCNPAFATAHTLAARK